MKYSPRRRPVHTALVGVSVAAIAWGALAFGAVYPWAYLPLAAVATVVGLADIWATREGRPPLAALGIGLAAVAGAIALQLVPLPQALLTAISPAVDPFLDRYETAYGVLRVAAVPIAPTAAHPLSIASQATLTGLVLFAALAMFFAGTSRIVSATGGLSMARPIIAFGILLALIGIGQSELTINDKHPLIYGFWKPLFDSKPFGPYVNPNHFAGWMLMALPLALGLFYESLQKIIEAVAAERDNRISIIRLPEFGGTFTFGFSSVVMALALFMTRSRSGLAAFAMGSLIAGLIMIKRQRSFATRAAVVLAFVVLVGGAGAWAGVDAVVGKAIEDREGGSLGGRVGAWQDTLHIIHDFPLTGSGFNTYGHAMAIYQTNALWVRFEEAHNDYLQLAAEGGLLVGLPILFTLGIFVRDVRRRFREAPKEGTTYWLRVGAVIGLVSIATQSLLEFSLQMPGNAALFAVVAAIAVHQSPNLRFSSHHTPPGSRITPTSDRAGNAAQRS